MLDIVCSICSESFRDTNEVCSTYCGHIFHHRCLLEWMQRSPTCPQCREHCSRNDTHKVFFTFSESLPSTSTANRNVVLENDLQIADDDDLYDLLYKADEVIRVLAKTDYEEIETIFALKEKVQEKEGTIMSYVEEVNRLKAEILALEIKVSSIESERERCEYKGTDLNNIMGTLKCDLKTENEIRKERELRLVQLDRIFLSPQEEEDARNEGVTDINKNTAERPNQLASAVPVVTQVAQTVNGEQETNRDGLKRPLQSASESTITTPAPQNVVHEGERPKLVETELPIMIKALQNMITSRKAEELLSLLPSTSQAAALPQPQVADRVYHWISGHQLGHSVLPMESEGSQVSSEVNSRSSESKQLLRLAKERAKMAGWKFVWRKYGQILARKEECSKIVRINNFNDLNRIA